MAPLITTEVPRGPLLGLMLLIVGAGSCTVKVGPATVMPLTVTLTAPLVAPAGTVVVKLVVVAAVTVAAVPLNFTLLFAAVGLKFVPVRVTVAPTTPLVGLMPVIVGELGVTVNDPLLVPLWRPLLTTVKGPLVAAAGIVTSMVASLQLVTPTTVPLS